MGAENGVRGHVDDRDRVVRRRHRADVRAVGFRIAHGDRERFVDTGDGLGDPAGVGADDRDGVGAVVGHYQQTAVAADGDATDRTALHRNLDHGGARCGAELEDLGISALSSDLPAVHNAHAPLLLITSFRIVAGAAHTRRSSLAVSAGLQACDSTATVLCDADCPGFAAFRHQKR